MKQRFKNRLLAAWENDYVANAPNSSKVVDGKVVVYIQEPEDSLKNFLKTYTLKKTGDKTSQGPNRRTRRKMWKSIQRPIRNSWLDDFWNYRELQPTNKPVRWEVAGVL